MTRTTLCLLTASVLAALSLGTMVLRSHVLGDEVHRPVGPGTWKVTLTVQGIAQGHTRVWTGTPLDLDRQRLVEDGYHSDQLTHKPPDARHPDRRRVVWTQPQGAPDGEFRLRSSFLVSLHLGRSAGVSGSATTRAYAAPRAGESLANEPLIESSHERISAEARELTAHLEGATSQLDAAQSLFHYVEQRIRNEVGLDGPPTSALACLEQGQGDRLAKSRLLVALLRNRNIPARIVSGVTLGKGPEQLGHYWVEAYIYDHWLPMCPYYRLFGRVPSTYLIFGYGDRPMVSARRVGQLKYAFLVERLGKEAPAEGAESSWQRTFKSLSLYQLPPSDRRLVEVLLLMPVAALIVCFFRNIIGLHSFGTFSPALIGLAFHDLNSWPGLFVFISILLVGWLMRRILDRYHLLQVPRIAVMLTLIMSVLIAMIVLSNQYGATTTRYISLFPIVILTGMVERFWTVETEDSTLASFKTLLQTMVMALTIALLLSRPMVVRHLFCYPETLGLVMAGQLLIGRYTGYRLMELFRFRDFLQDPPGGYTTQPA
ncbi:MAG: 7TM domain-containing protein [Gemmataceae bacterium]